jgi:hypothetical protein
VSPQRRQTLKFGQLVDESGGQQHAPRANRSGAEVAARAGELLDRLVTKRHVGILRELRPRLAPKVCWRNTVAAHEVVQVNGPCIAPRPAVGHEHALARAPERQGGLKPAWPTAGNQHVEESVIHP